MRLFSIMFPLFMADGDPIPTGDPPPPQPTGGATSLTCEFCECVLARSGEVQRVGKRAKKFRDLEDDVESRDRDIAERDATISRLNQEIADLKAKLPKKTSGW